MWYTTNMLKRIFVILVVVCVVFFLPACGGGGDTVDRARLESISVVSPPDKLEYLVGEKLDITGLLVHANMDDGTKKEITKSDGLKIFNENEEFTELGTKKITVEFGIHKDTFDISVVEEIEVCAVCETHPCVCDVGEARYIKNIKINYHWLNFSVGTTEQVLKQQIKLFAVWTDKHEEGITNINHFFVHGYDVEEVNDQTITIELDISQKYGTEFWYPTQNNVAPKTTLVIKRP